MNRKLIVGTLLVGGVVFFGGGLIYAFSDEVKPHELMFQFRGGDAESAKDLGLDKETFVQNRDALRDAHREQRMEARRERMEAAGCFSPEEIEEKLQTRKGRFGK